MLVCFVTADFQNFESEAVPDNYFYEGRVGMHSSSGLDFGRIFDFSFAVLRGMPTNSP